MVFFRAWPNTWIKLVLATVLGPPWIGTAPPLIRICPAAFRLTAIELFSASPKIVNIPPAPGVKAPITAGTVRPSSASNTAGREGPNRGWKGSVCWLRGEPLKVMVSFAGIPFGYGQHFHGPED